MVTCLLRPLLVGALAWVLCGEVLTAEPPATSPSTQSAEGPTPRQIIDDTIPRVIEILRDRSLGDDAKTARLDVIMHERVDFPVLSRILLGKGWDDVPPAKREQFIDVFSDYILGVYVPLMRGYAGEKVSISQDYDVGHGDHIVEIKVINEQGKAQRQVALLATRMRQITGQWKAIDLSVEGISIARVFGAQFRPVLANEGIDALIARLKDKTAKHNAEN